MEPKRLFRSRKDRVLGGVCGGLGDYFNLDPVLMRVIWVILFFCAGVGLLAYILCWIIIPEEPVGAATPSNPPEPQNPVNP